MFFMPWACSRFVLAKTHGTQNVPWPPAFLLPDDNSLLPGTWVSMLMEDRDEVHCFLPYAKVHRVGKPAKQRPANFILDQRELEWTLYDSLHDGVKFLEKLVAKSGPLLLVPCSRVGHVEFSLWLDTEASRHRFG